MAGYLSQSSRKWTGVMWGVLAIWNRKDATAELVLKMEADSIPSLTKIFRLAGTLVITPYVPVVKIGEDKPECR